MHENICIKYFDRTKFNSCLKKSICITIWVASWTSYCFHRTLFTWQIDKLWLFRFENVLVFSWEINKESLSRQGKQLTVFVGNNEIQVFKQKFEFWKSIYKQEHDSLWNKYIFVKISGYFNGYDCWYDRIKCVSINKICIARWISIFKIINEWWYKIMHE